MWSSAPSPYLLLTRRISSLPSFRPRFNTMSSPKEYVLTLIQHTSCPDCALLKNKIADVYVMSGLNRGDESKHWRVQIFSPPWDREARKADFPSGFKEVDVPALKLEVGGRIVTTTQAPAAISAVLTNLKAMLLNRASNGEMAVEIERLIKTTIDSSTGDYCPVGTA